MLLNTKKYYVFKRYFSYKAHPQSTFNVEVLPGIIAEFGEPRSKFRSKHYQLTQLSINKELYVENMAKAFWRRFHIKYIDCKKRGRKIPPIYKVVRNDKQLIWHGGYIVICEHSLTEREAFQFQNSFEYWDERFYLSREFSNDYCTQKEAISLLLNKISFNSNILKSIPTNNWRLFEELVAEIFRKFGFEISLTKKTRDGGKDIIALRREEGKVVERLLIECKHWKNKIDVKPVRNIVGVAVTQDDLPTGIILATTSTFTEDAKNIKINPSISIQLTLKDYNDILEWIGDYDAIQLTPAEIEAYLR
jgi:restriction endonuclease Mrr